MNTTRQRERWDGDPIELGDGVDAANEREGCALHPRHSLTRSRWELRLMTNDLLRSQVCRSSDEVLDTHEAWKTAMVANGWASGAKGLWRVLVYPASRTPFAALFWDEFVRKQQRSGTA